MTKPTREQIEFIRRHGITRCPPGPVVPMSWGGRPRRKDLRAEMPADVFDRLERLAATMRGGHRIIQRPTH